MYHRLRDHCKERQKALTMLFLIFCVHTVNRQQQHTPFGALQVRPVTQEVGEEAVEFRHTGPEDAIQSKTHTLKQALVISY